MVESKSIKDRISVYNLLWLFLLVNFIVRPLLKVIFLLFFFRLLINSCSKLIKCFIDAFFEFFSANTRFFFYYSSNFFTSFLLFIIKFFIIDCLKTLCFNINDSILLHFFAMFSVSYQNWSENFVNAKKLGF